MLCTFWRPKLDPGHNASQKKLKRHEIGTALEVKPEQGRMYILELSEIPDILGEGRM